jgi:hypothetical protein
MLAKREKGGLGTINLDIQNKCLLTKQVAHQTKQ